MIANHRHAHSRMHLLRARAVPQGYAEPHYFDMMALLRPEAPHYVPEGFRFRRQRSFEAQDGKVDALLLHKEHIFSCGNKQVGEHRDARHASVSSR